MKTESSWKTIYDRFRHSDRFAVFIVYATLLVDNMLLSAVAPILPAFLYEEHLMPQSKNDFLRTTISSTETSTDVTTETNATVLCETMKQEYILRNNNLILAIILASKPFVQMLTNAVVGPLTDKVGYDAPMFVGYIIMILSSTAFAFGKTYAVLIFARAVQGIGSAFASTSGLAMLAKRFNDDRERGEMLGIALGGLAMGILVGPVFGSVTYQFVGKETPFLILAGAAFIIAILQLSSRRLQITQQNPREQKSSLFKLLIDPYVLLAASAAMLGNMSVAIVEAGLPTWLLMTMCAQKWMLGVALLPTSISYMISTIVLPRFVKSEKRWLVSFISCYIAVAGTILLPFCKTFLEIIGPGIMLGTAVGMIDTSMLPMLGLLADTRHSSMYGSAFAIVDASFCLAFIIGPLITGVVVRTLGFMWLMIITSIINFTFAPLVCFLKNVSTTPEESQSLTEDTNSVVYGTEISSTGRSVDVEENHRR